MPVYKLPPRFYYDHRNRDLPSGEIVKETSNYVFVELTDDEKDELVSDARYYVEESSHMPNHLQGLIASARATLRRLEE